MILFLALGFWQNLSVWAEIFYASDQFLFHSQNKPDVFKHEAVANQSDHRPELRGARRGGEHAPCHGGAYDVLPVANEKSKFAVFLY